MSEEEVIALAETLVKDKHLGPWTYEMARPRRDRHLPHEWNVPLAWKRNGVPCDGPAIIVVDETTRRARFFDPCASNCVSGTHC